MKKTFLALTLMGASAVVVAQENTVQVVDDGRIAAKDMATMVTTPALPVLQSYVPDDILSNVKTTYGERLYSIKSVKSGNGEMVYQVTLIDDDQSSVAWVGSTGSEVAYEYRRNDDDAMNAGVNSTNTNTSEPTSTDAAPATDEMSAPVNTLDDQQAEPQKTTEPIDESTRTEMNSSLNEPATTVDEIPTKEPSAPEATKPEDEELY